MTAPIGLQLYSIREALAQDFEGGIRKVAEMGYIGVEVAGFPGTTPEAAAALFKSLGLQVAGAHIGLPLGDQESATVDMLGTLGCKYLVCPWMDPATYYQTEDQIRQACDILNEANAFARQNGLVLAYHNHDFEYATLDGRIKAQIMLDYLDPEIVFEVDTYWVKAAGVDPAQIVAGLGERAPLLHIKDGPAVRGQPMTAVGDGVIDVPAVIKAGEAHTEWLIVELDACATDMMEAVAKSYRYLTGNGLARGAK